MDDYIGGVWRLVLLLTLMGIVCLSKQFYVRTSDVTGSITLPEGKEMVSKVI